MVLIASLRCYNDLLPDIHYHMRHENQGPRNSKTNWGKRHMVREENLKNSAKKTPLIREDLYLVAAVYNTINGMKCVPFCRKKSEKAHSPKKKGMHIFTIHCFHHVEQEDEFHPFIVNTVKHFTECSKMLAFLPAACGMVKGWVVMLLLFFLLGHLAFGLTFYQPHSDMVLDRVELLGRDI